MTATRWPCGREGVHEPEVKRSHTSTAARIERPDDSRSAPCCHRRTWSSNDSTMAVHTVVLPEPDAPATPAAQRATPVSGHVHGSVSKAHALHAPMMYGLAPSPLFPCARSPEAALCFLAGAAPSSPEAARDAPPACFRCLMYQNTAPPRASAAIFVAVPDMALQGST